MNKRKDIGKIVNDHLSDAQVSPSDDMWQRIEATMDKNEGKKIGIFWLWLGLFLCLSGSGGYLLYNSITSPQDDKFQEVVTTTEKSSKLNNSSKTEDIPDTKNSQISNRQEDLVNPTNNSQNSEALRSNANIKLTENIITAKNTKTTKNGDKSETVYKSITSKVAVKSGSSISENILGDTSILNDDSSVSNEMTSKISANENERTQSQKDSLITTMIGLEDGKNVLKDSLSLVDIAQARKDSSLMRKTIRLNRLLEKEEEEKGKEKLQLSAYAFGGLTLSLPSTNTSFLDTSLQGSEKSGHLSPNYSGGLSVHFNSKILFSMGIVRSSYKYSNTNISTATMDDRNKILNFQGLDRDFEAFEERLANFLNGESTASIFQQLDFVEVPVFVNYRFGQNDVGLQVLGGVNAVILIDDTIYVENEAGNEFRLGKASNLNAFTFGFSLGTGAFYKLNDRFELELNSIGKYNINVQDNGALNGATFSVGLQAGVRYYFR